MSCPVLIVGATGAVGTELARRMRARGVALHLVARDGARLRDLASELGATHASADVTDAAALERAVTDAGPALAGLAYCVGSIVLKPFAGAEDALYRDAFELNLLGAVRAVRAALPALRQGAGEAPGGVGGAAIVLFSTVAVAQGFSNHAVISAAKGAVEGLTRALAADLAPKIRVNCVAPSLTRSKMAASMTGNPKVAEAIAALHALPRLGEPEDAAAAAAFLLSPESGWITGQVLPVDGGRGRVRAKG